MKGTNHTQKKHYSILHVLLVGILIINNYTSVILANESDTLRSFLQKQIETSLDLSNQFPDSAFQIAQSAFTIASHQNFEDSKAELLRVMGLVWYYKVDYARALEYFLQSYQIYLITNNKVGEASALNNISVVYRNQGFYEKALEMDEKILAMRIEIGDTTKIAGSLNNMAVSYKDMQKPEKSLTYFHQAAALLLAINATESIDLYYNNIGSIHLQMNQLDSAKFYFEKSLQFSQSMNHKQIMSNSYTYLGIYYQKNEQTDRAIQYFKKGLALAQETGIIYEIEWVASQLHNAYALKNDFANAYHTLVLFKQMADSAQNEATIQKITRIESELKFSQEREIEQIRQNTLELENQLALNKKKQERNIATMIGFALLIITGVVFRSYLIKNRDNQKLLEQTEKITHQKEEILAQRDNIEALNKTRDKFFAIIAHDLKNPLGGLYKLSEILNSEFETLEKQKVKTYLNQLHLSAKRAYELLDNLLQWSSLQLGNIQVHPEPFNLMDVMRDNTQLLEGYALQKNISVQFKTCTECIAYADPVLCNTVVRNLLTNALKFTPEKGTILLNITEHKGFWVLSVTDNGIGISENDQKLLFEIGYNNRNIGHSKEKGTGLGLILCKEFSELNGGTIWLSSELNRGTTFFVSVPQWKN